MSRRGRRHRRNQGIPFVWSDIGRTWMKVGLNMGRVALETSVDTLRTTADLLDSMSKVADPDCDRSLDRKAEGWPQGVEEHDRQSNSRGKGTTPNSAEPRPDDGPQQMVSEGSQGGDRT